MKEDIPGTLRVACWSHLNIQNPHVKFSESSESTATEIDMSRPNSTPCTCIHHTDETTFGWTIAYCARSELACLFASDEMLTLKELEALRLMIPSVQGQGRNK